MRTRFSMAVLGATLMVLATACPTPPTGGSDPVPVGTLSRLTSYAWGTSTARISGDGEWVAYLLENPDDPGQGVHLWERATLQDVAVTDVSKGTQLFGISTDGRYVTFARDEGSGSWSVNSYDRTNQFTTQVGTTTTRGFVQASAAGQVLYTAPTPTGVTMHRWSPATGIDETLFTSVGFAVPVAFSPDGESATYLMSGSDLGVSGDGLYAGPAGGPLTLVKAGAVIEDHPFAMEYFYNNVAITNDGDVVYTRFTEGAQPWIVATGSIKLWTKSTGTTTDLVNQAGRVVATTGVSADARYVSYLNLAAPLDTGTFDGSQGVFPAGGQADRLDRQSSTTALMAYGRVGIGELNIGTLADDGKTAVVVSNDPSGDTNGNLQDLFLWEEL